MEKRSKRWSHDETKAFLKFYSARQREFTIPRKRRLDYQNIVEDLISAGFDTATTAANCEVKMHTLLRAYKCAKDNAGATGASPCTPPFYEEMEEIFGDKPIHTRSESINIGSVPPNVVQDPGASTSQQTPSMEVASQEREAENTPTEPATSVPDIAGSASVVAASPPPIAVAAASARTPKESRNMSRSDFYKKNIQLRELEMAENKGQFEQRQKLKIRALEERQKRFDIKQKMFQERSNQ